MSTILSFLSGRQITNNSGVPQAGAKLLHYREGTTTALTVWTTDTASVAHAQPVVCDAGGFVPLIYVDDTFDWKVVITTAADVTLQTYDNLSKAVTAASSANFAPPLFAWSQVTSGASPVTLTVNDVGNAYEADATGGNIQFNLPSAAAVGNGKGFVFKKTSAANSMFFDPFGSETIDGSSAQLFVGNKNEVIGIYSNGAQWYKVFGVELPIPTVQRFTSGSGTYTRPSTCAWIEVKIAGGGGGGANGSAAGATNGVDTSFASWTAIHGNAGAASGGAGGSGGAAGSGTLISRQPGAAGQAQSGVSGGTGGSSALSGAGAGALAGGLPNGISAAANSGSGGGGAAGASGGGGGGGAEVARFFMTAAQVGASASYAVGSGGAGGTGANTGGNGAAGIITVKEYY